MRLTFALTAALAAAAIAGCGGSDSPQSGSTPAPTAAPTKGSAKKSSGKGKAKPKKTPKAKATPAPTKKPPSKGKGKVTITATPQAKPPKTGGPDETNRLPVAATVGASGISFSPSSVPAGRPLKIKIKAPKKTSITVDSSSQGRVGVAQATPKQPALLVLPRLKAGTLEFKAGKLKASLPVR